MRCHSYPWILILQFSFLILSLFFFFDLKGVTCFFLNMTDVAKMEVRKRPQPTDSKEDTNHNSNEGSPPPLKVASKEKRGNEAFCQLQNHPFSRRCSHSLLSSESDIQNYRGFLNLAGIILVCQD